MRLAFPATVALLVLAGQAAAQQLPAEYHVVLKAAELNLVARAMGKMPYDEVARFLVDLQRQVDAQQTKPKPDAPPADSVD